MRILVADMIEACKVANLNGTGCDALTPEPLEKKCETLRRGMESQTQEKRMETEARIQSYSEIANALRRGELPSGMLDQEDFVRYKSLVRKAFRKKRKLPEEEAIDYLFGKEFANSNDEAAGLRYLFTREQVKEIVRSSRGGAKNTLPEDFLEAIRKLNAGDLAESRRELRQQLVSAGQVSFQGTYDDFCTRLAQLTEENTKKRGAEQGGYLFEAALLLLNQMVMSGGVFSVHPELVSGKQWDVASMLMCYPELGEHAGTLENDMDAEEFNEIAYDFSNDAFLPEQQAAQMLAYVAPYFGINLGNIVPPSPIFAGEPEQEKARPRPKQTRNRERPSGEKNREEIRQKFEKGFELYKLIYERINPVGDTDKRQDTIPLVLSQRNLKAHYISYAAGAEMAWMLHLKGEELVNEIHNHSNCFAREEMEQFFIDPPLCTISDGERIGERFLCRLSGIKKISARLKIEKPAFIAWSVVSVIIYLITIIRLF